MKSGLLRCLWTCLITTTTVVIVGTFLEEDEDVTEHVDKVDEQLHGVEDVVGVSTTALLTDELSVVDNESGVHDEASPKDDGMNGGSETANDGGEEKGKKGGRENTWNNWC